MDIPLGGKRGEGLAAKIDILDFALVAAHKWVLFGREESRSRYASAIIDGQVVLMHRLLTNAPEGVQVDHIDGDGLNNRRENLRLCTRSQNTINRRPNRTIAGKLPLSDYKGVVQQRESPKRPWIARIRCNGKRFTLGGYKTEVDAAMAYDAAARYLHGEFANTNFNGSLALPVEEIRRRSRTYGTVQIT